MNRLVSLLVLLLCAFVPDGASAAVVYEQPPASDGVLMQSSELSPDGSDYDQFVWDSFALTSAQAITEIRWRGGYINNQYLSGPATDFVVSIYASIAANTEPDVVHPPLRSYRTGNNAGESSAGTFGGKNMYDYHFTLPAAFQAAAGVKYWVQIVASQAGIPDWGFCKGTGGNGAHFRYLHGANMYQAVPYDAAFSLIGSGAATFAITATADPIDGGTINGAGVYPVGSGATVQAVPNPGYGFLNWTQNNAQVSTSALYSFTVTVDRALVAHFIPAYTITTSALPSYAGSATLSGGAVSAVFNSGSSVTVIAAPHQGFLFTGWTEFGALVSTSPTYTFSATGNSDLVANFEPDPLTVAFDFDNAPVHTSLPVGVASGQLGATLSGWFSIQFANALGFTPAGFSGLCIYPNSVFAADLTVDFSHPLTYCSILYAPQELGCDNSATMRMSAYLQGTPVGSATATALQPGTWPTGTLAFNAPAGVEFDRVVIHYDSRPPTCQDWGPIFLADNMIATMAAAIVAPCPADFNGSTFVDADDLFAFLDAWFAQNGSSGAGLTADINTSGGVDADDLFAYLDLWFAGNGTACP